ncbi:carbon-nitrogen hydrolase [Kockovaella imperatae]|uniref:Carbon-nitrogen hydrolase n=1 Tax=Kockovaella imperatae TaxID=4999 RepID=A0A1Y1U968_9TREE|nr:carbon-nitrogen hydrolase [Kockovaella imperatae]ORX34583.1 carbon-nitrogen hydrolase [Kockovaella imperatae]
MSTPIRGLPVPFRDSPAPAYRREPLRVACVQFDVKRGEVKRNAESVEAMTSRLQPDSLDLLVLPEMCLSGYIFNSATAILPYLEQPRIGPTSLLARSLARRLRCHVVAGYPEALVEESGEAPTASSSSSLLLDSSAGVEETGPKAMKALEGEGEGVGFNSAIVVGPEGEIVGNYRKTFRFDTDKCWARAGSGFMHFDLPEPLGRTAIGICMDMNPKDFIAPWDAFELGSYVRESGADTLVVPMNWLQAPVEPPNQGLEMDPTAPDESSLNYWAARLQPLHDPTPGYVSPSPSSAMDPQGGKQVTFVACNRVGVEDGKRYVGTSCVMTLSSDPRRIELVEVCNMTEERVLVATVV